MSKFGIEETTEIIKLADHLLDTITEAFEKDGKIDKSDLIDAIVGNPTVVFKAIWGSWDVKAELMDLDEEEFKEILNQLLPILKKIVTLYIF